MGRFDFLNKFNPSQIAQKTINWAVRTTARLSSALNETVDYARNELVNRGYINHVSNLDEIYDQVEDSKERFSFYSRLDPDVMPDPSNFEPVNWLSASYGYVVEYDIHNIQGEFVGRKTTRLDLDELYTQEELLGLITSGLILGSDKVITSQDNLTINGALVDESLFN